MGPITTLLRCNKHPNGIVSCVMVVLSGGDKYRFQVVQQDSKGVTTNVVTESQGDKHWCYGAFDEYSKSFQQPN